MGKGLKTFCWVALIYCAFLVYTAELGPSRQLLASDALEAQEISVDEAAEGIVEGKFDIILDVRQPEEYEKMHILGALLIPLNALEEKARSKLSDLNIPILTYCRSGRRSTEAAEILRGMGYTNVVSIKGGITAWKEKGYPVVEE